MIMFTPAVFELRI